MERAKWIAVGVAGALVLGMVGAATVYAVAPDIPREVTVLGIKIGGKSKAQAGTALRQGLAGRAEELAHPVTVRIEGREATIQPQDVGLAVDVDATVEKAAKRRANPFKVFGKTDMQPVVNVDSARLVKALQPTAEGLGTPATLPGIVYEGLTPKPVYPVTGHGLEPASAAKALTETWLRKETVIPIVDIVPESSKEDVDAMVTQLAVPAVAAPVLVTTPKGEFTLTPEGIASSLVINSDEKGKLSPHVAEAKLREALKADLEKIEVQPKNATVGDGQIVASQPGELVDTTTLAEDLLPVLPKATERTLTATIKPTEPVTTTGHLSELGIKEQVSTFTTYFTGGLTSPRSINIITGANKIDGAMVKPGETFSLNGFTGPRGYAEGYKDAPIIMNGKLTPGVGGGMSQLTTTLYNAAYYAGLEDVEHHPHSIYFSTYPSVVDSTIFYPTLDLQFKNDTPYGVLIDTSYTNDSITVSMWSTKVYDSVKTEWSEKRNWTSPKPITVPDGPSCIARSGSSGFTQDAWRIIHKDGQEVKREKFTWRYDAEPTVICGVPKR